MSQAICLNHALLSLACFKYDTSRAFLRFVLRHQLPSCVQALACYLGKIYNYK